MLVVTRLGCYPDNLAARKQERLADHLGYLLELASDVEFLSATLWDQRERDGYIFGEWFTEVFLLEAPAPAAP